MTAAAPTPFDWLRAHAGAAFGVGALAAAVLLVWGLLAPSRVVAAGWLVGLVFWIGISLGALVLIATQTVTGGVWLRTLWPALAPATAALPLFGLLLLPILLDLGAVYPWVADPQTVAHAPVVEFYLNPAGWVLRAALALFGWSVFALLLARGPTAGGRWRPAVGGACLVFHAVALTLIAVDWVMSIEPRFRSTAFAAALGIGQVMAALAWAAALQPEPPGGGQPGHAGDLAGLLLSAVLGAVYFGFTQFLVSWYGDLPEKAAWFLERQRGVWLWLGGAALLLAALVPFAALLFGRVRRDPAMLGRIGFGILAGVLAHDAWLIGPAFGAAILPSAALATLAIGGLWIGLAYGPLAARLVRPAVEVPHGAA